MTKVYVSAVIDAPADRVWAHVRDFNGMPAWHPLIKESRIEQGHPSDKVGCIRNFSTSDGGRIREQLLALSDFEYTFTYCILDSPLGVENYVATMRLFPVTEGDRTFATWTAEFDCAIGREAELMALIGGTVFRDGFAAVARQMLPAR